MFGRLPRAEGWLALALLLALQAASASTPAEPVHAVPPPPGFISFCLRFADQCEPGPAAATTIALSDARQLVLKRVNAAVNGALWPADDKVHYDRHEFWTIPTDGYGDCDDYAVTKRKSLIDSGFPIRALRLAVVTLASRARHAVLVVVTDKGDLVLDNLTDAILERQQTGYTWIEQQDGDNPQAWVSAAAPGQVEAAAAASAARTQ